MKLSGSDIIVECLLEQGADTIFGYPGGAVLNIYDSLYKYSDKIRHVITCHEQDRKSTRLNSSHIEESRMPSSA